MFALCSNITLGKFKNVKPIEVKVTKSLFTYDRAVIKLPITARIKTPETTVSTSIETAKAFSEGDKVFIQLGYNGNLKTEFEGFIGRVNFTSPVEIECEGYSYQLRKISFTKTFVKVLLLDILKFLVIGTDIILDEKQIPRIPIDKFLCSGKNGIEVLEKIKSDLHNSICILFTGRILYVGLLGTNYKSLTSFPQKPNVKYLLGWNVIKDNDLKLRQSQNQSITVEWDGTKKDGSVERVSISNHKGANKSVPTIPEEGRFDLKKKRTTHMVTDKEALTMLAGADHLKQSYDGYEGRITTFLVPYCEPAYTASLEDKRYPERNGKYLVSSTEVSYGNSGGRRVVEIGLKL